MNRQRDEEDFRNNLKGIFYHLLEDHQFLPAFLNEAYLGHLKQHTQVLKNDYDNKYFAKIYLETCSEHLNFQALLHFFPTFFSQVKLTEFACLHDKSMIRIEKFNFSKSLFKVA